MFKLRYLSAVGAARRPLLRAEGEVWCGVEVILHGKVNMSGRTAPHYKIYLASYSAARGRAAYLPVSLYRLLSNHNILFLLYMLDGDSICSEACRLKCSCDVV